MKEVLKIPLKATLYRHQQSACRFACERFGILPSETHSNGVALLMEMGCGKTITSIAIVGILYQYRYIRRILITAPLSILSVWEQEFAHFAAFPYQLTVLKGSSSQKKEQLSKLHGNDLQIAVVNYESAWRLEKDLLAFHAALIIADEAHKIKENRTSQSKAMHHLGDQARYKLLLTGTLITNKELDVFSQYRFLNKEIFGTSFYAFRSRYFDMCGYGNHIPVFRKQMMDEFLQKLHSVAYRVTKAECLDLPQITEEIRTVELEPKAMKLYKQLEKLCGACRFGNFGSKCADKNAAFIADDRRLSHRRCRKYHFCQHSKTGCSVRYSGHHACRRKKAGHSGKVCTGTGRHSGTAETKTDWLCVCAWRCF